MVFSFKPRQKCIDASSVPEAELLALEWAV